MPRILYVRGFHPSTRARELAFEFERFGPLVRCDVPAPRNPESSSPYAFVEFRSSRDAEDAYFDMHGKYFQDNKLSIQWAKNPPSAIWRVPPSSRSRRDRSRSPPPRRDRDRDYRDRDRDRDREPRGRHDDRDYRDDRDRDRRRRSKSPRRRSPRDDRDRDRDRARSPPPDRDIEKNDDRARTPPLGH